MPHMSLKLLPGVDTTKTPTLNEASISSCNLIRFLPDGNGAVPQKLGGWVKYPQSLPFQSASTVRALKAWEDTNANTYLGVGAESNLYAIYGSTTRDITPRTQSSSFTGGITTTAGSATISVNNTGSNLNVYSNVYFTVPVFVGGIILNGPYAITQVTDANNYQFVAQSNATYTNSSTATITIASPAVVTTTYAPPTDTTVVFTTTGALPTGLTAGTQYFVRNITNLAGGGTTFNVSATPTGTLINTSGSQSGTQTATFTVQTPYLSVTSGSPIVTAYFPNHGYVAGSQFYIPSSVALTIGGITLSGVYTIQTVSDTNTFQFIASNTPTSTASAFINTDKVNVLYYYGAPPPAPASGYSSGAYSSGPYSGSAIGALTAGSPVTATDWFLDNWGDTLIANPVGGPIYAWQPNSVVQNANYISNAPVQNQGVFVAMPQRQLVAWGSTFTGLSDPLLIRWSDVQNYNVWTAAVNNQAGSYRLTTGSKIVSGMQANQQGIFWTDLDMWVMQYVGYPNVYSFNQVATNCGLIGEKAAGRLGNSVYWMSQNGFFRTTGSGADPLVCTVWDVVFQNINRAYANKIRCAPNTSFNEMWWFYPSANSTEIDSYVKFNVVLGVWDYGTLARTAWIDQSVLGPPIGSGTDNYIYQHEVGYSAAGQPLNSTFTTGYFQLQEADKLAFVDQIWPDMKWGPYNGTQNATVYVTLNTADYPTDTPTTLTTYAMTNAQGYISCRVRGRLFSFTINSTDGAETFWRLGNIRFRVAQDGKF